MAKLQYVGPAPDITATQPLGKGAKVIVHCCNNIGAWGAGFVIALSKEFGGFEKKGSPAYEYNKWYDSLQPAIPQMDKKKKASWLRLHSVLMPLGEVQFVDVGYEQPNTWVANIIGQNNVMLSTAELRKQPKGFVQAPPIDYAAITAGLRKVFEFCKKNKASVHCPKFGAGLAGGDWNIIEASIQKELVDKGVNATVYEFCPPAPVFHHNDRMGDWFQGLLGKNDPDRDGDRFFGRVD